VMLSITVIYFLKNLFLTFLVWWQTRFAYEIDVDLSQRLFTTYLRQPYTFHLQRNSAQLFHNINSEVGLFTAAIGRAMLFVAEGLILLGITTLLLVVEPIGALLVVSVLGGAAWTFHRLTRAGITRWGELRQYHSELSVQHLMQGLSGVKDVKLLGRETEFLDQFRNHAIEGARVGRSLATLQSMPRLWLELLMVGGLATLVLSMVAQGIELQAIVPTVGLFAAAAFRLTPSVNRVLYTVQALRYDVPVFETLLIELALPAPPPLRRSGSGVIFATEVRAEEVFYQYSGAAKSALEGVTVSIARGESVGFIGASGAGKSTLIDIILGLLTPASGRITVDGRDIQSDLRAWQDQIGYVAQSIYLTDDTIRRNVAFGLPAEQIDDEAVQRALRAAQLDEFVATLPAGIETFVGERGIRLSGGQRQRIGIARALYHDPAVLVFDEATSSLDNAAEQEVMKAIDALQGKKTVLIVAHRLSTVVNCDRLYKLEGGRIVSEGSPEQLLAQPVVVST
jgi:ATP-binding cassette, subfamily B, bacterial PglK